MIDSTSGHLKLGKGQIVSPFTDLHSIQMMNLGAVQENRDMGNNWTWHNVKNLKIDSHYFNISFLFKYQNLNSVTFVFQDKTFDLDAQWESWNEEFERNNERRFNDWLDIELDKTRHFDWGVVSSNYNPKSGFSCITIKYA